MPTTKALLIAAVLLGFPAQAAAWSPGLEPGAKMEATLASTSNGNLRRLWAIDDGNVVSRLDVPFPSGGSDWTNHGHGGSPTMLHGVSATSYVEAGNLFEHVFYVGQDWNLYVGTIVNGGPLAWQVYAKPANATFVGHVAATSFLFGGQRYLAAVTTNGQGTLFRWVRLASGGAASWATNTSFGWIGQYGITVTKNPSETIVSFFTDHNLANRSVGMQRWNGSAWIVGNVGHPAGITCNQIAAIQGSFNPLTVGYRFTIACVPGPPSATIHLASATTDTATTFTWTSHTLPAPVAAFQGLAGATRPGSFQTIVHEFFVLTSNQNHVRIGVGSSSVAITDMGPARDVDALAGGLAVIGRSGASRLLYVGRMTNGYRLFERRGLTTSNAPADYRWGGSPVTNQFWITHPQAAEAKIAAWRGTEVLAVMSRPGTGGPTDFPSTHLVWSGDQNEILDPSRSQQVTKLVNVPGVGNVQHDYVGDPTVVMTQSRRAWQTQLGQVTSSCTATTITRSTIYMVSTLDGLTHTAPLVVESKANASSEPALDHPWSDIEHRPVDTFSNDVIHIVWWDVQTSQIKYRAWFESSGGFGPVRTLRTGGAGPPRVTASDTGRVIVYYGVPNGQLEICELDDARTACTNPPGSVGGWTPIGAYYYLHNVPVAAGGSIRSWYPVSAAMSESDPNTLHYCVEVRETDLTESDVKCGRVTRDGAGSWTVATSVVVNAVADDDKDQFLPEVAVTSEDDLFAAQDTVLATWYDRAHDPANDTFQVMKSISTDGAATFAPPRAGLGIVSDGQFLPRHCRNSSVRFLGDYAAAEGDLLHKNMPAVVVTPNAGIHTWVFSLTMGLGSWGE